MPTNQEKAFLTIRAHRLIISAVILLPPAITDQTMVITVSLITRAGTQPMASVNSGMLSGQEGSRETMELEMEIAVKLRV